LYKKRLFSISCATILLLGFSGCANKTMKSDLRGIESDPISERIVEASNAAASSLKVLARVNNAKASRILSQEQKSQDEWQNANIPFNLDKKVDIDKWSGPAESVLRNLAEVSNYRFRVSGYAPIPEIVLSVSGKDKMIIDYLYDIGYQLGDRGDVVIHPPLDGVSGIIDLKYLHKLNN